MDEVILEYLKQSSNGESYDNIAAHCAGCSGNLMSSLSRLQTRGLIRYDESDALYKAQPAAWGM